MDGQHRGVADRAARRRAARRPPGGESARPGRAASRSRTSSTSSPRARRSRRARSHVGGCAPAPRARPGPAATRRERTGPSPRSIDSARPRWSPIRATTGTGTTRWTSASSSPARAARAAARPAGRPATDPGRRRQPRHRRHARRPAARSQRAATSSISASGSPRQVDDDGVVTAPGRRQHLADGERLQHARASGVPGEDPEAIAPRQALAAATARRAGPWSGTARPSGPRTASSSPSTRSRPGPSGSASITTVGPRRAPPPGRARPRSVVAPAPPDPPITPTVQAAARAARRRGRSSASTTHSPDAGSSATFSAPSARAMPERLGGEPPQETTWTPSRRGGRSSASSAARSAPTSTSGAAGPAAQRGRPRRRDVGGDPGRGTEPQQLVEEGLVAGDDEWRGHVGKRARERPLREPAHAPSVDEPRRRGPVDGWWSHRGDTPPTYDAGM